MKHHVVIKLHGQLADSERIPYWVDLITDKSVVRESVNPEIDRLMRELALKFWLATEYRLSVPRPSDEEIREGLNRTYRMILQEDYELPANLTERIRLLPSVEEARELDVSEARLPTPQLATQASVTLKTSADLIYLPVARMFTKGESGIMVAVLDTGLDAEHAELKGKVTKRADFVNLEGLDTTAFVGDFTGYDDAPDDEVGHGTHVSGIIGARGLQMDQGVAPDCSLMAVRVLATMKDGDQLVGAGIIDNINTGIKWAVDNGADVINMSLGIRHTGGGLPHQDVIRYALSKNVTVVAASGNDGTAERYYPGALQGVVAVGATDDRGEVAGFTSYGARISVVAPGSRIYSSFARHGYAFASGTSQAAPFVTGAVALMKSYALERGVKLTNRAIRNILKHTSDRLDRNIRSLRAGYGLINLADAFKLLQYQFG
jgi:subtilisin family serine protease